MQIFHEIANLWLPGHSRGSPFITIQVRPFSGHGLGHEACEFHGACPIVGEADDLSRGDGG